MEFTDYIFLMNVLGSEEEEIDKASDEYTELEMEGLDYDELCMMDEDERREVLEEAGLDPDDYDF